MTMRWMIYGANGYTGKLIAREAAARGLAPVLAGRRRAPVEALAAELGLEHRIFDLVDPDAVTTGLAGIELVLHVAGPFSATSAQMIEGCLRVGAHYLDITGEISVFEQARTYDELAHAAGIVVCPGVGFDVIPTDCVGATLLQALPDATHLSLGFDSGEPMLSPGTARTMMEMLRAGGRVRVNGRIEAVPHGWKRRTIDFGNGDGAKWAMTVPWGDVSTAFHSTGIANIEVYIPAPRPAIQFMRVGSKAMRTLMRPSVQRVINRAIDRRVVGPEAPTTNDSASWIWGEVTNAVGEVRVARLKTVNGYSLTIAGALAVVDFLLAGTSLHGCHTPSSLMGADMVTNLPGVTWVLPAD